MVSTDKNRNFAMAFCGLAAAKGSHVATINQSIITKMRSKNKLLAAIGVPLLTLLLILAASLPLAAQQLPNPSFATWGPCYPWTSTTNYSTNTTQQGETPTGWTISHTIGTGNLGNTSVGDKVIEYNDNDTVVKLYNTQISVIGVNQVVPGYMTLGTTWSTSSMNKNNDGGTFGGLDFNYRPDAIEFLYKRSSNAASLGNIIVYGWKGQWTQQNVPGNIVAFGNPKKRTMYDRDRNIIPDKPTSQGGAVTNSDDATLIFSADANIDTETDLAKDWTKRIVELSYKSGTETINPQKINVIFSCNTDYWDSGSMDPGQDLYIDDVKLIYYSRLASVTINGVKCEKDETGVYQYNDYIDKIKDNLPTKVECELLGQGKSASTTVEVNPLDDSQLSITVTGIDKDEDGLKQHTYTVQGKRYVSSRLASINLGEEKSVSFENVKIEDFDENGEYTYDYPGYYRDFANIAPNSCVILGGDKTATVSINKDAENDQIKITVTNSDIDVDGRSSHIYRINCNKYVFPQLTKITFPKSASLPNGGSVEFKNGATSAVFNYYIGRITEKDLESKENPWTYELTNSGYGAEVSAEKKGGVLYFTVSDDGDKQKYTVTGPHCSTLESISLDINGQENDVVIKLRDDNGNVIPQATYDGYINDILEESSNCEFVVGCTEIGATITKDGNQLKIYVGPKEGVDPKSVEDIDGQSSHTYIINCWSPAEKIAFNKPEQTIVVGQQLKLTVEDLTFGPDGAHPDFVFSTTSKDGVQISDDKQSVTVTSNSAGTVTITATSGYNSELSATATITINALPTAITVNETAIPDYIYLDDADAFDVEVGYEPAGAPITGITLTSDPELLTVTKTEDGKWTVALKEGAKVENPETVKLTATVAYKNAEDKDASLIWDKEISVENRPIIRWYNSENNLLSSRTIGMVPGETKILSAKTSYFTGEQPEIEYIISNGDVISYADGELTAKSVGTSTLTARVKNYKDKDGKPVEHEITVKVSEKVSYPATIVGPENLPTVVYLGDSKKLALAPTYIADDDEEATVHPDEEWTVSDNAIASVDEHGNVSIKTPATFDPKKQKTLTVTLNASYTDANGETQKLKPMIWTFEVVQPVKSIAWQDKDKKAVTDVTLKENQKAVPLTAVVTPAYATDKSLTYTIDNPDVVEYKDGVLTAKGVGTATITATSKEWDKEHPGISKSVNVTVESYVVPAAMTVVNASEIPTHLYIGETMAFDIKVDFTPSVAGKDLDVAVAKTWTSSNPDIVKVSSTGRVSFADNIKTVKDVTISLEATYPGASESFKESWPFVVRRPVASLDWLDENGSSVAGKGLKFKENQIPVLRSRISPAAPTDEVKYSVIPEEGKDPIIGYEDGKLIVKGCGTNTLVARAENFPDDPGKRQAKEKRIVITVEPIVRPTDVTITGAVPEILYIGETAAFTISKTYVPSVEGKAIDRDDIEMKEVWTTSNPAVLKVSQAGRVSFADNIQKPEDTKVTMTTTFKNGNGETETIEREWAFTVRQPVTDIEWRDENGKAVKSLNLAEDATMNLAAVIKPETATDKELTFEVRAGKEKAKVIEYEKGVLRAVGRGSVELVAIADNFSADGREKIEFKLPVEVSAMTRSVAITEVGGNEEFYVGKTYKFEAEITPAYDEQVELTWTSSDPDVATIAADGTLTALTAGTTTITVAAPDGNKASYMVKVQDFPAISTEIPGYLTVTAPDGTSTTIATSLGLTTTSWTTLDLTLDNVSVNGFPLGNVGMDGVEYSTTGTVDAGSAFIQLLTSQTDTRLELDGGMPVGVAISAGTESFVDLTDRPEIAEVHFDLSFIRQGLDLTAVFSTKMPADFEDPGKPEAGTTVDYNGSITLNVVATRSRAQETETFTVDATLKVTYLTEPDADGLFTADIEVPALHFGAIDEESVAPGEEPDYRYNLESFVLDNVAALRKGNVITYSFDETEVATEADGYYLASIDGKAKDDGSAVFTLSVNDNNGTIVNGSFNNDGPEGELYKGYLNIEMAGSELADNMPASVIIIPNENDETVTFLLPNLTLEGIGNLGDIRVENVSVTTDPNGTKTYEGYVEKMQLLGGGIEAEVKIAGTIDADGYADMTINVTWMNIPINVKFTGEHSGTTTGIEAPEATDDAAIDGPVEYYTIGGIRVADGQHLAPGFYIERRGNKARKILVR